MISSSITVSHYDTKCLLSGKNLGVYKGCFWALVFLALKTVTQMLLTIKCVEPLYRQMQQTDPQACNQTCLQQWFHLVAEMVHQFSLSRITL